MGVERRILITGSRVWTDKNRIKEALTRLVRNFDGDYVVLISGACPTGADALCEEVWNEWKYPVERHPADWDTHGKKAGFVRNADMANLGADVCVGFLKNNSKGTKMMIDLAKKKGIPTVVLEE